MEFVSILRQLWQRKLFVFVVFLLAVCVAISSAYKVPSMQKRGLALGAASSQILVDSPASTLVEGADAGQLTTLATRARVYAQFLSSLQARDAIAKASGIPARAISTNGPFSTDIPRNTYQPQPSEARANDVLKEGQGFRLVFDAQDGVPIITVSAQAPTAEAALALAHAAFVTLKRYVDDLQREADAVPDKPLPKGATAAPIVPDSGVTVRELGAPEGGTIGGGNGKILMFFAFFAMMAVGCSLIAIVPGMARHWRLLDRAELLMDDPEAVPVAAHAYGGDGAVRFGAVAPRRLDGTLVDDGVEADDAAAKRTASGYR
jgi:hypothetical protein